ncbi:hypothetical protein NTE_00253 [Candidatus Nitrososphaera evergladensis SR1]|uniref:Uncharacterized protein n=1 Tax=Candidatus Nitrososphaera evergladensis SR1 TaxID=1459636 RepID=A0A075MMH4_9ARCH|nr:hypothetical protein [Candidatus Nitrososphaera evergladensis]AIF82335.1 hypothetical protein NTE_00253 [Candidatus Nitrososphaera evergladensis SR1]
MKKERKIGRAPYFRPESTYNDFVIVLATSRATEYVMSAPPLKEKWREVRRTCPIVVHLRTNPLFLPPKIGHEIDGKSLGAAGEDFSNR